MKKLYVFLLILVSGTFFWFYFNNEKTNSKETDEREMQFAKPISVEWTGRIMGCLNSCAGYSVERMPANSKYPYFQAYNKGDEIKTVSGTVKIVGKWIGIDCGYINTVFDGYCTPSVEIEEIQSIN